MNVGATTPARRQAATAVSRRTATVDLQSCNTGSFAPARGPRRQGRRTVRRQAPRRVGGAVAARGRAVSAERLAVVMWGGCAGELGPGRSRCTCRGNASSLGDDELLTTNRAGDPLRAWNRGPVPAAAVSLPPRCSRLRRHLRGARSGRRAGAQVETAARRRMEQSVATPPTAAALSRWTNLSSGSDPPCANG